MKILYLAPHLSTGGMPAFLLKTIETLRYDVEIFVETFYDSELLSQRPHLHRPSELQQLPPLRSAVVDVNGHFACAAMCSDGGALFNTLDVSSILYPGGESTALALTILAGDRSQAAGSHAEQDKPSCDAP